ncbi:hypothetical protein ABFX02_11G083200 [Erythranthe guttata]
MDKGKGKVFEGKGCGEKSDNVNIGQKILDLEMEVAKRDQEITILQQILINEIHEHQEYKACKQAEFRYISEQNERKIKETTELVINMRMYIFGLMRESCDKGEHILRQFAESSYHLEVMLQGVGGTENFPKNPEFETLGVLEPRLPDIGPSNIVQKHPSEMGNPKSGQEAGTLEALGTANQLLKEKTSIPPRKRNSPRTVRIKPRCRVIPSYKKMKFTMGSLSPIARETRPSGVEMKEGNRGTEPDDSEEDPEEDPEEDSPMRNIKEGVGSSNYAG